MDIGKLSIPGEQKEFKYIDRLITSFNEPFYVLTVVETIRDRENVPIIEVAMDEKKIVEKTVKIINEIFVKEHIQGYAFKCDPVFCGKCKMSPESHQLSKKYVDLSEFPPKLSSEIPYSDLQMFIRCFYSMGIPLISIQEKTFD